jgi:hypothetical protein
LLSSATALLHTAKKHDAHPFSITGKTLSIGFNVFRKAIRHPSNWGNIKKWYGTSQYITQQESMQDLRCIQRSDKTGK